MLSFPMSRPHLFEPSLKTATRPLCNPLIPNNLRTPKNGRSATSSSQETCALLEEYRGCTPSLPKSELGRQRPGVGLSSWAHRQTKTKSANRWHLLGGSDESEHG